jgi:hypothetical protein
MLTGAPFSLAIFIITLLFNITFRNYKNQESWEKPSNSVAEQLFKDSLAFWLLRMHGYDVSSGMCLDPSYKPPLFFFLHVIKLSQLCMFCMCR